MASIILAPFRPILSFVNFLLPFTSPGTPLLQDIIHTFILCTVLYLGPPLQQYILRTFIAPKDDPSSIQPPTNDTPPNESDTIQDNTDDPAIVPGDPLVNELNTLLEPAEDEEIDFDDALNDDALEELDPAIHDQPPPPHANGHPIPADAVDAGPANPAAQDGPHRETAQRNVGAKKAKSLARREQRRAYHEFQRSRGDAQRAEENKDAEEREAALYEEKRRRAVAEMEIEEKKRVEGEARKERERKEREDEMRRREVCVRMVRDRLERDGRVSLREVAKSVAYPDWDMDGEGWATRLVRGSGILGVRKNEEGKVMTMITGGGYVVRVREQDMSEMYRRALEEIGGEDGKGRIAYEELGGILEQVMKSNVVR